MTSWAAVEAQLRHCPVGTHLVVRRHVLPHPARAGAHRSVGLPAGQHADWRFPPAPDCMGLHVHEHPDVWRVHLDQVHPSCDWLGHLQADAPGALLVGAMVVGAVVGGAASRRPGGVAGGAGLGALLATVLLSGEPNVSKLRTLSR